METLNQPSDPSQEPGADAPKKVGRPSKQVMGLIESSFLKIDTLFNELAHLTGMTRTQLIARWQSDAKGPNSPTAWNMYLRYYAENKEAESHRVASDPNADPVLLNPTAFRALCYTKYQEQVADWHERLLLFEELESFSVKGMTVASRNAAFRKFIAKLKKCVSNTDYFPLHIEC
jgi:hypothetical protein